MVKDLHAGSCSKGVHLNVCLFEVLLKVHMQGHKVHLGYYNIHLACVLIRVSKQGHRAQVGIVTCSKLMLFMSHVDQGLHAGAQPPGWAP